MANDYYTILGVSRTASADEIKRAYRKLAHEYHPDKNSNHADGTRFKEINEAYQVLSNPDKKAQYDQFGTTDGGFSGQTYRNANNSDFSGFSSAGGFSGFSSQGGTNSGWGSINDIFEDFFGGVFSQVQSEIEISFTSAILGDRINLQTSEGEKITLNIPAGTQDGQSFRFPGKGGRTKRGRGDLIITVRVTMPRRLSREQKELLERLKNTGM